MGRMSEYPEVDFEPVHRPSRQRRRPRRIGRISAALALTALAAIAAIVVMSIFGLSPFPSSPPSATPVANQTSGTPVANQASATPGSAAAVDVPADNHIATQAKDWGVSDCLGRVVTLSDFLTKGASARWLLTRGTNDANKEMFSATIAAKEVASGLAGISNLYASPAGDGRCDAAYQTTVYLPESCSDAHERVFPRFLTRIDLGSEVADAFATVDGSARLFLLPAGASGCVAVKTEILY